MIEQETNFAEICNVVLDNLGTAVLVLNEELVISDMNPAAETLLDVSAQRARGKKLAEVLHASVDFYQRLERIFINKHPFSEKEAHIQHSNDDEYFVDYSVNLIPVRTGSNALLLEIVRQDRQMRMAHSEQMMHQQEATRLLIRGVAHEVKNPLGGLRGAAQLLERELPNESLKEYTQIIIGEADRLQNLADRMLGPNNLPQKRNINIHEILEHVRQLVSVEAGNEIVFVQDYDPSVPELHADREQMIQCVLNITRNAVTALKNTGIITYRTRCYRNITIGQQTHRLVAKIDIIDNGPGIPGKIINDIFMPMISGHAEGTGLGLSIAQTLVNQHGGIIECESHPGETEFTIKLPVGDEDES